MSKNNAKLIIVGTVLAFIFIPIVLYLAFGQKIEKINITNYNDYAQDLPPQQRNGIDEALYRAVEMNLSDGEKIVTTSASIRNSTAQNSYNKSTDVISGSFIVDLEGIRQSYEVFYDWSNEKDNPNTSGTPIAVNCISSVSDKIYKDFSCRDGSEASGLPLENQLPYTDINGPFKVIYMYKQGNTDVIGVTNSTPNGRKKAIEWLKSKNIDPSSVIINYLDMRDQLRSFKYAAE